MYSQSEVYIFLKQVFGKYLFHSALCHNNFLFLAILPYRKLGLVSEGPFRCASYLVDGLNLLPRRKRDHLAHNGLL